MLIRIIGASLGLVGGGYLIEEGIVGLRDSAHYSQVVTICFLAFGLAGLIYGIMDFRKVWIQQSIDMKKLRLERERLNERTKDKRNQQEYQQEYEEEEEDADIR